MTAAASTGLRPRQTRRLIRAHAKIAGKQVLRKGLSPLATTISIPGCAPVIAGMRKDRLGQECRADGRPGDQDRP